MYTHVRTDRTYPPHLYRSAVVLRGDDTRPNSYRGYRLLSNNAKTKDAEEVAIHRIRVHSRGTFRLAICAYVMEHGDDIKTMRLHCYLDALCRTTATGVIAKTVYVTYIYSYLTARMRRWCLRNAVNVATGAAFSRWDITWHEKFYLSRNDMLCRNRNLMQISIYINKIETNIVKSNISSPLLLGYNVLLFANS